MNCCFYNVLPEAELATDNISLRTIEQIVTHSAPGSVDSDL